MLVLKRYPPYMGGYEIEYRISRIDSNIIGEGIQVITEIFNLKSCGGYEFNKLPQ